MTQFVALDFETANADRSSVCSIGMVKVVHGKIVDRYYSLVDPQQPFDRRNIAVHGIMPRDVQNAPRFSAIYKEIQAFIGHAPIAAHFAQFDVAVLRAALHQNHLPVPSNPYFCSCMLAKSLLTLPAYKLNVVADHYHFSFKHHNALEDATACAVVVLQMAKAFPDILSFVQAAGYSFGYLNGESFRKRPEPLFHPFHKKALAFTSDLAGMTPENKKQTVSLLAGTIHSSVQENTDYVIVSDQDAAAYRSGQVIGPIKQAKQLQAAGSSLKLVSEAKFFQTIGR